MERSGYQDTDDEFRTFRHQISGYKMCKLQLSYEFFKDDLIYIIDCLDSQSLLSELKSRTKLNTEELQVLKRDRGSAMYAEKLVSNVFALRREDVIGFWESLYIVNKDYQHPNLSGVLYELTERGDLLMEEIQTGCGNLTPEIKDIQAQHKKNLWVKTQALMEFQPPGSTLNPQSFLISKHFVDLIVITTNCFRQKSHRELIEKGVKHQDYLQETQRRQEHFLINRIFRWCHQLKNVPKIIMASGVPGIGKTTLMQKFICGWLEGKIYQNFSFVFFFKFRDLNRLDRISLEDMILQQYSYLYSQLDNIFQLPEQILFIFDGLDESIHQIDFTLGKTCTNVKQTENLGTVIVSLVKQAVLKGCSVLMTSRPTKTSSVDIEDFQRCVEIMGFSSRERQEYFEQYFGNKEKSDKAFKYVKENSPLYTFCYIPSYCWIICTVLSMCFQNKDHELYLLSKTVTELFVIFVAHILENHSMDKHNVREILKSTGHLAQYGILYHILVFEEEDMNSFNLDLSTNILSSFMIESDQCSKKKSFTFLHHILQEFLAALVNYLDYSQEKLLKTLKKIETFKNLWGELYVCFLCGLSDFTTNAQLKKILGGFPIEVSVDVINWLKNYASSVKLSNIDNKGKRDCLNRFYCLFESRNKELVLNSIGANKEFDFSNVQLTPMDCVVLAFILECCKTSKKCCLDSCFSQSEDIERLFTVIHTINEVSLSRNLLQEKTIQAICNGLSHFECRIQILILLSIGLSDDSCQLLANAINQNSSLVELHLSDNNLNFPQFNDLIVALSHPGCRIQHLALQKANLQDGHAESLVKLGESRNLTRLNLNYNSFTEDGYHFLNHLIQLNTLQEIRICSIEVPREKITYLVDHDCRVKVVI